MTTGRGAEVGPGNGSAGGSRAGAGVRDVLVRCSDDTVKVGFTLTDGRDVLGWVTGVAGDHVYFLHAPGPFDLGAAETGAAPEPVPIGAIRPGSVAWYDAAARRWVPHEERPGLTGS